MEEAVHGCMRFPGRSDEVAVESENRRALPGPSLLIRQPYGSRRSSGRCDKEDLSANIHSGGAVYTVDVWACRDASAGEGGMPGGVVVGSG